MRSALALGAFALAAALGPGGTALEQLARALAASAAAHSPEGPIAVHVRAGSPELGQALTTLLCAELSARGLGAIPLEAEGPEAAERVARERDTRSLVRLSLALEQGRLVARGDLLGTWVNFWSGATPTRPARPAAALEGAVEADAQALALAAAPTLPKGSAPSARAAVRLRFSEETFAHLDAPTAALAAGDLDGDGRDEVVALTDEELIAFSPEGKVLARRAHRSLPASPSPCREPVGSVAIYRGAPPRVAYFSSRRAKAEVLELDAAHGVFRAVGLLDDVPFGGKDVALSGRLIPGANVFAPELSLAGQGKLAAAAPFVTLSAFGADLLWVHPDGTGVRLRGVPPQPIGRALAGLGAGSALVDVDGDDRPEVVTSSPAYAPEPDQLRILDEGGSEAGEDVRWQGPVSRGRVLQVTGADVDRDGAQEVVLGVWLPGGSSELRLFRREAPP